MATWPDLVTAVPTVSFWLPTRLIWKDQESFLLKVKPFRVRLQSQRPNGGKGGRGISSSLANPIKSFLGIIKTIFRIEF